jgi:hypothetical protein
LFADNDLAHTLDVTCRDLLADMCAGKDGLLLSEIEDRIWWGKEVCVTAAYRIAQKTEMQVEVVHATVGRRKGWGEILNEARRTEHTSVRKFN